MQNSVLMGSPLFSAIASTWSRWNDAESGADEISPYFTHRKYVISLDRPRFMSLYVISLDAESCAHGISPFLTDRKYVISLAKCRIVCSWDLPVSQRQKVCDLVGSMQNRVVMGSPQFHPQKVCDLVGSMQNSVLMRSTHVSPTVCTWSRWIDVESCTHGISPFFTHRKYVISLDQCRILCSWDLPMFHQQEVHDLVGSMQNRVLMRSPHLSPTAGTWSRWIDAE